jgi:tyrosyl-tRNA synthetase
VIAQKTLDDWNARFSERRLADADLPAVNLESAKSDAVSLVVLAYQQGFGITKSRADANRLIKQGSVQLEGKKIVDPKIDMAPGAGQVLRLDKTHAVRIA